MGDQRDYAPRPGGVFYNQGTSDSQGYGPPPGSPPYLTPEAIRGQQMQHLQQQQASAQVVGQQQQPQAQQQQAQQGQQGRAGRRRDRR
jgi:hypothetical protein